MRHEIPKPISKLFCAFTVLVFSACATSFDKRGVYHSVRQGDSIWRIARAYRVDVQELAEFNNIMDPEACQPGMRIYIPAKSGKGSYKKLPLGEPAGSRAKKGGRYVRKKGGEDSYSKAIELYRGRFTWPIEGKLGSLYGYRNGRRHDGVDIGADTGTPIHAAASGRVVFSGNMRGYGNLILIRHEDDFFTAYAHNSVNKAKKGKDVKQGEVIAAAGRTGRATAPHLHFEIRHGQTARNPLFFLPEKQALAFKENNERKRRKK